MMPSDASLSIIFRCTQRNIFQILLNQTEIRLYLPFSDWYGTKRTSVWFQINLKMVNTIWFKVDFEKIFLWVAMSWSRKRLSTTLQSTLPWHLNKLLSIDHLRKAGHYNSPTFMYRSLTENLQRSNVQMSERLASLSYIMDHLKPLWTSQHYGTEGLKEGP